MNILITPRRRRSRLILKKILRLKMVLIVFILLLVLDVIFTKILGEKYEDRFPVIFWTSLPFMLYVLLGLCFPIVLRVERSRKYYLIPWILLLSVVLFVIYWISDEKLHSWFLLNNILSYFVVSLWVSVIILLLLQIPKIRKAHFSILFSKILFAGAGIKKRLTVNTLLLILILSAVIYYGNAQLQKVNSRLDTIENRLGGPKKIGCNEKDTINKVRRSVVRIVGGESEGSGFAVKTGGLILTNFHVIEFEPAPKVVLPDNTFETAEVIMADKNADLAIIKISKDLPVISWGEPTELEPAEELLAIGFPLGGSLSGESSVNKGSLAGRRKSKDVGVEYLQTDITLTPGVSGGPMVNVCGDVMGINTAGLSGLGLAISADSAKQKWLEMASSDDSLKDIKKISFNDTESAEFAVATFYNYLKVRKLDKAFDLLSDNFKNGHGFDYWKGGYTTLLDTTVINIGEDKDKKDRVKIKLSTKDMVDDEIVYKYFEGYWDAKNINGKWRLWDPEIKEVKDPGYLWFYE